MAKLIGCSDNAEDLRPAVLEIPDWRMSRLDDVKQAQSHNANMLSPFVLNIPQIDSSHSSPGSVSHFQRNDHSDVANPESHVPIAEFRRANATAKARPRIAKVLRKSRHGIPRPRLPSRATKRIASSFLSTTMGKNSRVSKEILLAVMEAGDQYFDQLGGDLATFSNHAGRKKIDESDVIVVMRR